MAFQVMPDATLHYDNQKISTAIISKLIAEKDPLPKYFQASKPLNFYKPYRLKKPLISHVGFGFGKIRLWFESIKRKKDKGE